MVPASIVGFVPAPSAIYVGIRNVNLRSLSSYEIFHDSHGRVQHSCIRNK